MADIRGMKIGQIVDFCIAYNERNKDPESDAPKRRRATQADIDAYFG